MKCKICNGKLEGDCLHCKECEKNMEAMAGMDKLINKELDEQIKRDKKFLEEINHLFSQRVKKFFKDEMEEIGGCGFCLVDKPEGQKQPSPYAMDYYVDQWSVGQSGDSFEGNCYLRLANGKYLKWSYEC